jgi:tetratricopeptide (TPR) repeat protein
VSVLLLAGVFVVMMRAPDVTAISPQPTKVSYIDVIELYRRGEDELALKQFALLTDTDIRLGRKAVLTGGAARIRAATVLHTVRAFAARAHDDAFDFQYQFRYARGYVSALMSRERRVPPFVQTWQLFVMSSYHGQRGVQAAREFGRAARDPHGDSALLLLALGATEEMGWSMQQEEDPPANVDGDLKDAERDYRQALVLSPELIEARLRLGRVLALRNDDESMRVFDQIAEGIEAPYQYLARLFEGDVYERAGKLADAERQYLTAVALMPESQSAFLALAHVRYTRGARAQSAQDVRVTTGARGVPDTADPWFWYSRGTAWRGPVYLDDLRKMIAP